jgi:hypothetical protein
MCLGVSASGRSRPPPRQRAFSLDYDSVQQLKDAILADPGRNALKSYSYDCDSGGNRTGEAIDLNVTKEVPNNLNQLMTFSWEQFTATHRMVVGFK